MSGNWLSAMVVFNCLGEVGQGAISSDSRPPGHKPAGATGWCSVSGWGVRPAPRLQQATDTFQRHKPTWRPCCCLTASSPPHVPVAAFGASSSDSCSEPKQPCEIAAELFPFWNPAAVTAARSPLGVSLLLRRQNSFFNLCQEPQPVGFYRSRTKHPRNNFIISYTCVCGVLVVIWGWFLSALYQTLTPLLYP